MSDILKAGGSGETNTLADPAFVGQSLALVHDVDGGGNRVISAASALNQAGNNTITLADAADYVLLQGVKVGGALKWRVVVADGAGLTTV